MNARGVWPENPNFIEFGVHDADLALGLRQAGYSKYLGVSSDAGEIARLQATHPEMAGQLMVSKRRKLILHNNADVIILSGAKQYYWWKFYSLRHAGHVAWRLRLSPLCLVAFLGCLYQMISRRCTWPRIVNLPLPDGSAQRVLVSRVRKRRLCHRRSLHFVPHQPGLSGLFQQFDQQQVRYVVLRWFESLPEIEPSADVDLLIEDASVPKAMQIMRELPGIQPADLYSETGLTRSDYNGLSYYPPRLARRILEGAVRHKDLCFVPSRRDYFHSLAYHVVYQKGFRSGLSHPESNFPPHAKLGHDYARILRSMADELGIDVEISLEGLHTYLQANDWGPTPDMLARLASACPGNRWLQILTKRLMPEIHDQGLTVFVLRQEAVRRGFQDKIISMIEHHGFEVLAVKKLTPEERELAAAKTRGGDWSAGDYQLSGGPPAVTVVAYDLNPISPNRKQRRKFPQRTNARIFIKETIRDAIVVDLPPDKQWNALHSSDHAAEAWHLIDVLAPELKQAIESRLNLMLQPTTIPLHAQFLKPVSDVSTSRQRQAA